MDQMQKPIEVWAEHFARDFPGIPVDMDTVHRRIRGLSFHEGGHTVMCSVLDLDVEFGAVSIIPNAEQTAWFAYSNLIDPESLANGIKRLGADSKSVLRHRLLLSLAGPVAEDMATGATSPYEILESECWQEAQSEQGANSDASKSWRYSEMIASGPWSAERIIESYGAFAFEILSHRKVRPALERLADELMVHGTMQPKDYLAIVEPVKGLGWMNRRWFGRINS